LAREPAAHVFDWFAPEVVVKAEYYEVEEKSEKLLIFTQVLTGDEERWWEDEIDAKEQSRAQGSRLEDVDQQRAAQAGAQVRDDRGRSARGSCGYIAGENIPIVPVYGKRWFVDNQERFRGHVSKLMDAQRIYNAKVSKLAETTAWRRARSRSSSPSRCRRTCRSFGRVRSRSGTPMRWSTPSSTS
jgi:hypothetical protein